MRKLPRRVQENHIYRRECQCHTRAWVPIKPREKSPRNGLRGELDATSRKLSAPSLRQNIPLDSVGCTMPVGMQNKLAADRPS